jgi:hypothetical protein
MTDCCTPGSAFPNAATMQQLSTNYPIIWDEICRIQQAILAASSQCQPTGGKMSVTVAGTTPMTFVAGVVSVDVIDGGLGYYVDTPSVEFVPPMGSPTGAGATANVITNGGNILEIQITDGGIGYQPVSSTMSVSSVSGTNAILEPLVDASGSIIGINIVDGGTGYTLTDSVVAFRAVEPNPYYSDAMFKITAISLTGEIISIAILYPGTGYQPSVTSISIISSLNPTVAYPLGAGFDGTVFTNGVGTITSVLINNIGAGYADFPPYLIINDPGTGCQTSVVLDGTSVDEINIINSGNQYTETATGIIYNPPTAALPNPPATPADITINVNENTYGTDPVLYWQVWAGVEIDKPIQLQLNSVLSYFTGLGYTIIIQSNPLTNNTIQWRIMW